MEKERGLVLDIKDFRTKVVVLEVVIRHIHVAHP